MTSTPIPAYLVAQIDIKDYQDYIQRYAMPVIAMLQQAGAEVMAASPTPTVLEGQWSGNWTVVLRFPSMAVAEEWYRSAAYQPLKALRMHELTRGANAVFVEGFDPAALAG